MPTGVRNRFKTIRWRHLRPEGAAQYAESDISPAHGHGEACCWAKSRRAECRAGRNTWKGADGAKGERSGTPTTSPHVAGRIDLSSELGSTTEAGARRGVLDGRRRHRSPCVMVALVAKVKAMRRCAAALCSLTWKASAVEAPAEKEVEHSPVKSFASAGRAANSAETEQSGHLVRTIKPRWTGEIIAGLLMKRRC